MVRRATISPDTPVNRTGQRDLSGVANAAALDIDVLARVRGQWKRIRVDGSIFEFCRDDPAEDIDEYILVVSNHDRTPDGRATGSYLLRSSPSARS